jgi:hypothetical protein
MRRRPLLRPLPSRLALRGGGVGADLPPAEADVFDEGRVAAEDAQPAREAPEHGVAKETTLGEGGHTG